MIHASTVDHATLLHAILSKFPVSPETENSIGCKGINLSLQFQQLIRRAIWVIPWLTLLVGAYRSTHVHRNFNGTTSTITDNRQLTRNQNLTHLIVC